jgi:hypothetical protein
MKAADQKVDKFADEDVFYRYRQRGLVSERSALRFDGTNAMLALTKLRKVACEVVCRVSCVGKGKNMKNGKRQWSSEGWFDQVL